MSMLVTVSELQERVRTDCNLPPYSPTTNVSSTQILDYVRRAAQKLSGILQQYRADEQYLTLSTTLVSTAGIPVVSLPSNCQDIVRLAMVMDPSRELLMQPAPLDFWDPNQYFWDVNSVPYYRVIGNTITLFPTPTVSRTIKAYYTVGFSVTTASDVLALRPNWDEYIVQTCNIWVRDRQEKDASTFRQNQAEARTEIIGQLKRDRAGVRQVRDVRWPGYDQYRGRRWPW